MIITFPPNGASQSKIYFSVQSNASKQYLFVIGASSQIMAAATLISFARSFCFFIMEMEFGCTSKRKLNRECAVLPPSKNVAAIPDDGLLRQFFHYFSKLQLMLDKGMFYLFCLDHQQKMTLFTINDIHNIRGFKVKSLTLFFAHFCY